ncbi:hypothetical protein FRX31_005320, partial [Thalictrum thalictroides]
NGLQGLRLYAVPSSRDEKPVNRRSFLRKQKLTWHFILLLGEAKTWCICLSLVKLLPNRVCWRVCLCGGRGGVKGDKTVM